MLEFTKICQRFSNKICSVCKSAQCVEYEIPNVILRLLNLGHLNIQGLQQIIDANEILATTVLIHSNKVQN